MNNKIKLIVTDDASEFTQENLNILQSKNISVIFCAKDGKAALDTFSESEEEFFDLIFTDLQMPVMDGYEEARQIRSLPRKDAQTIPIIALTAYAFENNGDDMEKSKINDYVLKPVRLDLIQKIMEKYLKHKMQSE